MTRTLVGRLGPPRGDLPREKARVRTVRVAEIWRYPVKSLQGERLDNAQVDPGGLHGDRAYAIFDATTGFGLTARRAPELLFGSASVRPDGQLVITLPDGSVAGGDDALSDWLGRRVHLRPAADTAARRYENPADFEDESGRWEPFDGSPGAFHDSARASVSLLSRASIAGWDPRRFRANLLLDEGDETELAGKQVAVGLGAARRRPPARTLRDDHPAAAGRAGA